MLEKHKRPDQNGNEPALQFQDLSKFIDVDENDENNPLFDKLARAPIRRRRINAFEKSRGMSENDIAREQEIQ